MVSPALVRRAASILIALGLLAMFAGPTRVAPVRSAVRDFRWVPLILLGLAAAALAFHKKSLPRALRRADAAILAFIGLAFLSTLYSIAPWLTFLRSASLLVMYGAVFWGLWIYADRAGALSLARLMLAATALAFGLHIIFAIIAPREAFPYLLRFSGWAENPGTVAVLAAVMLPLALWHAIVTHRWAARVLAGVLVLGLVLSQSRLEAMAALTGSGYFLWRALPRRRVLVVASLAAFLAVHMAWLEIGPRLSASAAPGAGASTATGVGAGPQAGASTATEASAPTQTERAFATLSAFFAQPNPRYAGGLDVSRSGSGDASNFASLGGRMFYIVYGAQFFLERPLLGFGFGAEDRLLAYHDVPTGLYVLQGTYFHNSYLGVALQLGLVGVVLFLGPLAFLLWREFAQTRRGRTDPFRFAVQAVVLTGLTSGLLASWLYSMGNAVALPFWTCVMLFVRGTWVPRSEYTASPGNNSRLS